MRNAVLVKAYGDGSILTRIADCKRIAERADDLMDAALARQAAEAAERALPMPSPARRKIASLWRAVTRHRPADRP
jgi:hypothetical protein